MLKWGQWRAGEQSLFLVGHGEGLSLLPRVNPVAWNTTPPRLGALGLLFALWQTWSPSCHWPL